MPKYILLDEAKKDLVKLDKSISKKIIAKLDMYSSVQNPLEFAKSLVNLPPGTHRFRIGDFRVTFYKKESQLFICRIAHRKDIYDL